ncbi:MAG: RTX toxin [Acidobacteriota bacterium]
MLKASPHPLRRLGRGTVLTLTLAAACAVATPALAEVPADSSAPTFESSQTTERFLFGPFWRPQGPGPIQDAQVENVTPDNEAVGAIHTVAPHPFIPDILFAGTVNGGIWKTRNATDAQPRWFPLTDFKSSLSIGALEFDPTDPFGLTLVAGVGTFSSFGTLGGELTGLLRSNSGGFFWRELDGGGVLTGKNVSGVAPRGRNITISVDFADTFTFDQIGIFRSTDRGATFAQVSGSGTGLPLGVTNDLVGDPNDVDRLFTSVTFADAAGGANGFYRSDDAGASWAKVSDAAIDALLISGTTNNVEFAVGEHDNVYAAVVNAGRLAGVFRSGDGGTTWTAMDLPGTVEDGVFIGVHPGGQGFLHTSIVADPVDPDIVYIGGDRQPGFTEGSGAPGAPFPNSIGAENFSGRLFRGDASQAAGSQFVHLTHSNTLGGVGGGTASNSSPHADSREMKFDAAGSLIETDDGGIYRRTSPRDNTGDWQSLNGNIQTNEQHDLTYDSNTNTVIAGTQDNGTPMQNMEGTLEWFLFVGGDGGDTAVDDTSTPGTSIRYSSAQNLQAFNRSFWDVDNNFLGFAFAGLNVVGGGAPVVPQFVTPIELNEVDPTRIIIGGANSTYESFDQGDTLTEIGPGIPVNGGARDPIAYGAPGNPDILYIGSGDSVFVRTGPPPAPLVQSLTFPGTGGGESVRDIVIDPADPNTAYAINQFGVFQTTDAGATWTDVSGTLAADFDIVALRAIAYVEEGSKDRLVVSGFNGIFVAKENQGFTNWKRLGRNQPNAPAMDLDYDAADDALVVGFLGRGAWKISNLRNSFFLEDLFEDLFGN